MQSTYTNHMIGKRCRKRRLSAGFTLIEIMFAFTILTMLFISMLYTALAATKRNRLTELQVAGSAAVTSQYNFMLAVSKDNEYRERYYNSAKTVLSYLNKVESDLHGKTNYPFKVALIGNVLTYEFMIPEPGGAAASIADDDGVVQNSQYDLGVGVVEIHLKEDEVPEIFWTWNTVYASAPPEASIATGLDMDGDGKYDSNFSDLYGETGTRLKQSGLTRLPVTVTVRYYASRESLEMGLRDSNRSSPGALPGFSPVPEDDRSIASITRNYLINDDSLAQFIQ